MQFTDRQPAHPAFRRQFRALAGKLDNDHRLRELVFNLAASAAAAIAGRQSPVTISLAGAQGSGKSTLARLLRAVLETCFSVPATVLSLDDFYLPKAQRAKLARQVHPLLAVRGVPGTHDIDLLLQSLAGLGAGQPVAAPVFDKAVDDRLPDYRELRAAPVILCEGWCWGARPEPAARLDEPVNALERDEDKDGAWRRYVNESLARYQAAFAADGRVFFLAPSMAAVCRWRWWQERELGGAGMTREGVRRFVGFYERLTRWMGEDYPARADVTVTLAEDHAICGLRYG